MNAIFVYDFTKKAIIGSNASIDRANKGKNPEYTTLCSMLAEHPDFNVFAKLINVKKDKQSYHGLNLKRMEEYISTLDDSKKKLAEFRTVQIIAEAKGAKYPLTKKWFLNKYPEYKDSSIKDTSIIENENQDLESELESLED